MVFEIVLIALLVMYTGGAGLAAKGAVSVRNLALTQRLGNGLKRLGQGLKNARIKKAGRAEGMGAGARIVELERPRQVQPGRVDKKLPVASIVFSQRQLDRKFKHAVDFGVVTTKKNAQTLRAYELGIMKHMSAPETVRKGTYGFVKGSKVYFNPTTNNIVVVSEAGEFVTGFNLKAQTPQLINYIENGVLR
ncbi:colicin D domain-containing protein [Pseudomonas sp. MWU12-2319]|uniref:colicin D domain-containing protein n=1 Tax=unclassified Pseudomonas TaxID=196821 RepID=UPI00200FB45D